MFAKILGYIGYGAYLYRIFYNALRDALGALNRAKWTPLQKKVTL